jgi:hypothetical protein
MRIWLTLSLSLLFAASAHAQRNDARFEQCRTKLKQLQQLSVLYDFDWPNGGRSEPVVTAGPTFFRLPIDGKTEFARTVNCFTTVGDDKQCMSFNILHWQTGKVAGRWYACKLTMN